MVNPDFTEPHLRGHGFDPDVCEGCPHHETDGMMNSCGKCGCPTNAAGPMNLLSAPPESCVRLPEHESDDDGDGGGWL